MTSPPVSRALREAVAVDLRTLAALHDAEPDRAMLEELRQAPLQDWLGLCLETDRAQAALGVLDAALAALPRPVDDRTIDQLAVDYANIYLTFGYRAAATESVWLDQENLERQEPMFAIREWYQHYGLAAEDWRRRSDDHLVLQLQFLAHLFELEQAPAAVRDAARFMDRHLLRWIGDFAERVAGRCGTPYFAGVALITAAYLEELREVLVEVAGEPRWRDADDGRDKRRAAVRDADAAASYVPGAAPSW